MPAGYCLRRPYRLRLSTVIRTFRLLLLFGAFTGLFGQAVAVAAAPQAASPMSASPATAGMSDDCMKMMAKPQPDPAKKPCKGMTLACIAAMGCAAPMILREDVSVIASRDGGVDLPYWHVAMVLRGSELSPEPEPPTLG